MQKISTDEPICRAGIETGVDNKSVDTEEGRGDPIDK